MASGPVIFDRALLNARKNRARRLGAETFLLDRVADDLVERLGVVTRKFDVAADIGTPTSVLLRSLSGSDQIGMIVSVTPEMPVDRY
ncbi:MAG: SAM-dependent methyltransferase, partial [Xanthobacteraceae bacterium]